MTIHAKTLATKVLFVYYECQVPLQMHRFCCDVHARMGAETLHLDTSDTDLQNSGLATAAAVAQYSLSLVL